MYLVKVNHAISTLYARHVLATLLADWPVEAALSEEALELNGTSHMAYILDMLMQLEERLLWEKVGTSIKSDCMYYCQFDSTESKIMPSLFRFSKGY